MKRRDFITLLGGDAKLLGLEVPPTLLARVGPMRRGPRTSAREPRFGRPHPVGDSHCDEKRTLRDSISLPQLVFLPRAEIAGNAAIFSPR